MAKKTKKSHDKKSKSTDPSVNEHVVDEVQDADESTDAEATEELDAPDTTIDGKITAMTAEPTGKPVVVRSSKSTKRSFPVWGWVVLGVLLLGGITVLGLNIFQPTVDSTNTTNSTVNIPLVDQLVPRKLDGVMVAADQANPNIFAVMIENIRESRPPSGLDEASVVYEALAEGGITRFMALFPIGNGVSQIGPIRSARQYYVDWAEEYNPLYVHVGGSPQALQYLRGKPNVIDFNQFTNGPFFTRDKSRRAPHNLYSSTDMLYLGLKRRAPNAVPSFTPWSFKEEPSIDDRPEGVKDLAIEFSGAAYRVMYKYDRALNQYQRWVGGAEHVTKKGHKIYANNIVIQFTKTSLLPKDKLRLHMETVGQGKMLMVRDGTVVEGVWNKESKTARTQFLDTAGLPLALNPGKTWIEIVPTDRKVTY